MRLTAIGSHESYVRAILVPACTPVEDGGLGYRGVVVNFRGCKWIATDVVPDGNFVQVLVFHLRARSCTRQDTLMISESQCTTSERNIRELHLSVLGFHSEHAC